MQQSASTGRRPAATSSKKTVSAELRTLRLKEQLLTEELTVTEDLLKSIVADVGVPLDQTTVDDILEVPTRRDKVLALLAALQNNWKDQYFQQLCAVLESVDNRLADELSTELERESGKLAISDAIDTENGRIVFKEFGHEKRLSELEKKRLHSLLNRKSQCTRDIWEKQFNRLNAKLDAAFSHSETIDAEATRLCVEIESFIAANAADSFTNRAVVSTTRSVGELLRDVPALQHFDVQLNCLVQLSGQSCLERDNIADEKDRVLKRIDDAAADNTPQQLSNNVRMTRRAGRQQVSEGVDVKLGKYIEQKKQETWDCQDAIQQEMSKSEKLEEDVRLARREKDLALLKKQQEVDDMKMRVEMKDSENDQLAQCLEALKQELSAVSDELSRFNSRSSQLERGRRVNTIFNSVIDQQQQQQQRDAAASRCSARSSGSRSSNRATSTKSLSSGQLPRITENQMRSSSSMSKRL